MGKLRKEGNKWVVDFRLPRSIAKKYGVSRFRKLYENRAMAAKIHAMITAAITLDDADRTIGRLLGISDGKIEYTVASFSARFLDEYCVPRLGKSTLRLYSLNFRTINPFCGDIPLKGFKRQHLHNYVKWRAKSVAPSTVNKDIIAIKRMFSYAFEIGVIEVDPLIRFPVLRVQEKALRLPAQEEFRALVEAMPEPAISAMIAIMGESGLRRSEAINLKWDNVDLRNARLTLEHTKSKKVRVVPLSSYAMEILRELTRFIHQPYVFAHQITGERWKSPDKSFREGRRRAGLEWITMHTLRHMRATRWLENGADIESVKEGLGHQSIQTTHRYVRHVEAERRLRDAFEREAIEGEKREAAKVTR